MKKSTMAGLAVSHVVALAVGFAAGFYYLPILTAPPAPAIEAVEQAATSREFTATFSRDREDSDALHWGEGEVTIGRESITFTGELAPGPDYKLYLSPEYVETEADFIRLKSDMLQVGDVKTFDRFILPVPAGIDPADYSAVIVWCESFSQYITSGRFEPGN